LQTKKGKQNLKPSRKHERKKTAKVLETHVEDEDEDDDVVDKQLGVLNRKVQMLQKEKEKFAIQLEAKRKAEELQILESL
jgi:hypothetical protein